jgi:hypothetical protein
MITGGPLTWNDTGCTIGDLRFRCDWQNAGDRVAAFPDFIIMKDPGNIQTYERILKSSGNRNTGRPRARYHAGWFRSLLQRVTEAPKSSCNRYSSRRKRSP